MIAPSTVLATLRPGRALNVDGQWEAVALPATTLPKVRDRLAALVGGEVALPFGLSQPALRAPRFAASAVRAPRESSQTRPDVSNSAAKGRDHEILDP